MMKLPSRKIHRAGRVSFMKLTFLPSVIYVLIFADDKD
jgi:hypothetical protein